MKALALVAFIFALEAGFLLEVARPRSNERAAGAVAESRRADQPSPLQVAACRELLAGAHAVDR
jgi:hypothetical protein